MDASEIVEPVGRPAGVTAAAVVAVVGSVFALILGLIFTAIPLPPQETAVNFRAFAIGMGIFIAGFALLGCWTAVGLFNLRPWARVSILSFAIFITGISAVTIIFFLVAPIPVAPGRDPNVVKAVLPAMIATYSIPLLIGIWWIIQFTRPVTKAAFAAGAAPGESERPLSISVIGAMHLIGGLFVALIAIPGMPLLVAGAILTGWKAKIGYLILGGVSAYIGWGLLRLDEKARRVAIGYIVISSAHGMLVSLVPSFRLKLLELQNIFRPKGVPPTPDPFGHGTPSIVLSIGSAALLAGVMLWFLVKNKPAFARNGESQ